ncbi:MAG: DUF1961 family protein [Acidobacteriota bacterium]
MKSLSRRTWFKYIAALGASAGLNSRMFAANPGFHDPEDDFYLNAIDDDNAVIEKIFYKRYRETKTIYENPLKSSSDVKNFALEGQADISFPNGRLRIENTLDPALKQKANLVYWCPEDFPDNIAITWDFYPFKEPGLCIFFFSAKGIKGENLFSSALNKRSGEYKQYHHGDINAFHVSYFRRNKNTRDFQLCNLRKSYGHNMVVQGADPISCTQHSKPPYHMRVVKFGPSVEFYINELLVLEYTDDGKAYGPFLGAGKIGFRQMSPLVAEYSSLRVASLEKQ